MDVGLLFVTLLLIVIYEAEFKSIELCKFKYRICKWNGQHSICGVSTLYCKNVIACDEWTTINIKEVKYGTNYYHVNSNSNYCKDVCNGVLGYYQAYTSHLMTFCNGKQECELNQWNPNNYWKLDVSYDCKERYQRYTRKVNTTSVKPRTKVTSTHVPTTRPQPQQTTTSSNDTRRVTESETEENNKPDSRPVKTQTEATQTQVPTTSPRASHTTISSSDTRRVTEYETENNNASDQFPMSTVAASVTAGVTVLAIVLTVVVCIKRRRRTIKCDTPNENALQMQIIANNDTSNATPSAHRTEDQETDEHEYVDIALQNDPHTTDGTFAHEYVYLNADKVINKDMDDDYNTLNTHPAPFKMDPNYDHIPNGSHTTVDETYSHISDGTKAMSDATYSHLNDTISAASRHAKSNQNNSDNVYNHINTKSVEENVYNNSQTSFNKSLTSHGGKSKAIADDYDHTDWKQNNNSKPKHSNHKAVGKLETNNITERARDEYAIVKKRSDKVTNGHNYFVLEKQFL